MPPPTHAQQKRRLVFDKFLGRTVTTPKPLPKEQLPPVPEGCEPVDNSYGTWQLHYDDPCFDPSDVGMLRAMAAWLEQANGLAPQAEGERGELRDAIAAAIKALAPFEEVTHGFEWQTDDGTIGQFFKLGQLRDARDARQKLLVSLPAASSAEDLQRAQLPAFTEMCCPKALQLGVKICPDCAAEHEALNATEDSSIETARKVIEKCLEDSDSPPMNDAEIVFLADEILTALNDAGLMRQVSPPATTARGLPTDLEKIEFAIAALSPFEEATHGFEWQVDEGNYPAFFRIGILRDARDARDKLIALRDAYKKDAHA